MINHILLETGAALLPLLIFAVPLGRYMYNVYERPDKLPKPLRAMETLAYRAGGVDPLKDMNWKEYASCLLLFNLFSFLALCPLQQAHLWPQLA